MDSRSAPANSGRRVRRKRQRPRSAPGTAPYWKRRYWSRVITGRGSYGWRNAWRAVRPYVGVGLRGATTAVGAALGGPTGATIGNSIGNGINTILGMGSYGIKMNSLWASDSSQVPAMHSANETIRVTHREYIGDIITSSTAGAFKLDSFFLNPGLEQSFPWLAPIARSFTEYQVLGFAAEFKSNSSDAMTSTNTALGSVVMNALYNNKDAVVDNKQDMLNSMWAVQTKPSQNCILPIECDPSQNPFGVLYVRAGPIPASDNINMYDLATIQVATQGLQGTSVNVGELWFTYDIELRKPKSHAAQGLYENSAFFNWPNNSAPMTAVAPLTNMSKVTDSIGLTTGPTTIAFEKGCCGTYWIRFFIQCMTIGANTTFTFTYSGNVTQKLATQTFFSGTSGGWSQDLVIDIIDPNTPVTISVASGSTATNLSSASFCAIMQVNKGMLGN